MSKPVAAPSLQVREVDGEVVVYDTASKKIHVLNASAGLVLRLCDGAHSVPTIATRLGGTDSQTLARASADVERILRQFETLGLICA